MIKFDMFIPISSYDFYIAYQFRKVAEALLQDMISNKHESGAIKTNHPESPSGYQRVILEHNPYWYSDLYQEYSSSTSYFSSKTKRKRKKFTSKIRRGNVIDSLERIIDSSDRKDVFHDNVMREFIFEKTTDFDMGFCFNSLIEEYFNLTKENEFKFYGVLNPNNHCS